MAFPATSQALARAYAGIKAMALDIRNQSVALRDRSAAGSTSAEVIVTFVRSMARIRTDLSGLTATPGLGAYAQEQEGNPALNIVAEYNAMIAQLDATTAWVAANIPSDGTYNLIVTIGPSGLIDWRMFDAAATAGLRSALNQLIAAIS